jgi:hypothetical protein
MGQIAFDLITREKLDNDSDWNKAYRIDDINNIHYLQIDKNQWGQVEKQGNCVHDCKGLVVILLLLES